MSRRDLVLVVEDDRDARDTLCRLLDLEGHECVGASNGAEAVDRLDEIAPALPCLIVLDLIMPLMDGWELFDWLKANPRFARVPVVVVTAVRSGSRPIPAADFVLSKPIDVDALLDAIARHC
jgi:CheY-like chemotaxis protein